MNIFKNVKAVVSTKEAAAFYGINVGRNGMCCCPFHDDRNPSMKVNERYYCFGCGEKGDVIDFVGKLYGLSALDSAKKLADDFNIPINCDKNYRRTTVNPEIKKRSEQKKLVGAFEQYLQDALFSLHDYRKILLNYKEKYAPKSPEDIDNCNPLFEEAVNNLDKVEWMIDELTFGNFDEHLDFLTKYKGVMENVKNRLPELV